MKEKLVLICDGNGDDLLGFARLAAFLGNRSPKYPHTDFATLRFGWRGQSSIPDEQVSL